MSALWWSVQANLAAALWKKLGFEVAGTLPGAFRYVRDGYMDALVMYRG